MIPPEDRDKLVREILTEDRIPFFETSVSLRFSPLPRAATQSHFRLDYIIEFSAILDQIVFGIAESPLVAESLHSSVPELTECTVLQRGERMDDDIDKILRNVEITTSTNAVRQRCHWEVLSRHETQELLDPDSTLDPRQFRFVKARLPGDAVGRSRRVQIRMQRDMPFTEDGLPWIADRLLFLRTLTVDFTAMASNFDLTPHIFLGRYANANEIGEWDTRVLRLETNAWLVSGQGIMLMWRTKTI